MPNCPFLHCGAKLSVFHCGAKLSAVPNCPRIAVLPLLSLKYIPEMATKSVAEWNLKTSLMISKVAEEYPQLMKDMFTAKDKDR